VNLRQVLLKFCPGIEWCRLVFMSDRQGIIYGVQQHFAEAKHLYCVVHILRNIITKGMTVTKIWQVVEAISKDEFESSCSKLPPSSKLSSLMQPLCIQERGIRRYGMRTNNNAESMNNALTGQRSGPLLDVLNGTRAGRFHSIETLLLTMEKEIARDERLSFQLQVRHALQR